MLPRHARLMTRLRNPGGTADRLVIQLVIQYFPWRKDGWIDATSSRKSVLQCKSKMSSKSKHHISTLNQSLCGILFSRGVQLQHFWQSPAIGKRLLWLYVQEKQFLRSRRSHVARMKYGKNYFYGAIPLISPIQGGLLTQSAYNLPPNSPPLASCLLSPVLWEAAQVSR